MDKFAKNILRKVIQRSIYDKDNSPSMNGVLGNSLIYFSLSNFQNKSNNLDKSLKNFEVAFINIDKLKSFNLYDGIAGLIYMAIYFRKGGYLNINKEAFNKYLELLAQAIDYYQVAGIYDLLYGYLGIGVCVLELSNNNICKHHIIKKILDSLEFNSVNDIRGIKWYHHLNVESSHCVNLGALHGIPSILSFLSICYNNGIERKRTKNLIVKASEYLLYQKSSNINYSFLYAIDEDNLDLFNGKSRVAYCYGDLGVANSLLNIGIALKDDAYRNCAIEIAKKIAKKKIENSGVSDPYFCHGASGVLHILNRFYKETGDDDFLEASRYWLTVLDDLIDMEDFNKSSMSILTGKGGIILTLIEMVCKVETNWDRIFLIK